MGNNVASELKLTVLKKFDGDFGLYYNTEDTEILSSLSCEILN